MDERELGVSDMDGVLIRSNLIMMPLLELLNSGVKVASGILIHGTFFMSANLPRRSIISNDLEGLPLPLIELLDTCL